MYVGSPSRKTRSHWGFSLFFAVVVVVVVFLCCQREFDVKVVKKTERKRHSERLGKEKKEEGLNRETNERWLIRKKETARSESLALSLDSIGEEIVKYENELQTSFAFPLSLSLDGRFRSVDKHQMRHFPSLRCVKPLLEHNSRARFFGFSFFH